MKILTIGKILNDYEDYLTQYEIEQLREVQKTRTDFSTQVEDLKYAIFGEEWNFMGDSFTDSKDRSRGVSPMSREYIERVNKKRKAFGVSPLNNTGFGEEISSDLFCEEVVRHTKNYKELLELKSRKAKQIVFVDMDGVLVNFQSGINKISEEDKERYRGDLDDVPGIFSLMEPNEGAIEGYKWLCENFDTYILSTAPWDNPSAWQDKLNWVKKYFPDLAYKRLILSHNKHLANGDFLIDDRTANGAGKFPGKHIHFNEDGKGFKNWKAVLAYMKNLA